MHPTPGAFLQRAFLAQCYSGSAFWLFFSPFFLQLNLGEAARPSMSHQQQEQENGEGELGSRSTGISEYRVMWATAGTGLRWLRFSEAVC